jgi:hypothetical protein
MSQHGGLTVRMPAWPLLICIFSIFFGDAAARGEVLLDSAIIEASLSCTDASWSCEDHECLLGDPCKLSDHLPCGVDIGGWTQVGYHTNDNGLYNARPHEVQLHQQVLYFEKLAEPECGLDWGARLDTMYGTDGQDFQAFFGSQDWYDNPWDLGTDYGWALFQAYFEIACQHATVKLGRFYTLIGYEYGTAPDDFFYSHTYTFFLSEPLTHTGVLLTYRVSEKTEISVGWVDGWDTAFEFTGGSQLLGGIQHSLAETITVYYAFVVGEREHGLVDSGSGYNHSFVVEAQLTERLEAVLHSDLVNYSQLGQYDFDVNQRFVYTLNDFLAWAVRGEWWHTTAEGGTSSDIYALTAGLNVRPHANVVFRPEIRWDWNPDGARGIPQAGLGAPVNELDGDLTFAMDAVIVY